MDAKVPGGLALVLLLAGCTSASSPAPETNNPARDLLEASVPGDPLDSGWGALRPVVGSTLNQTPEGTVGVTLQFACTGGAAVSLRLARLGSVDATPSQKIVCNDALVQESVELPGPVTFEAVVTDDTVGGSYAFGYYAENE